jgi:hypothetical protein
MLRKLALLTFSILVLAAYKPGIDPDFPVNQQTISAPTVARPIHDCARVVHVSAFFPRLWSRFSRTEWK